MSAQIFWMYLTWWTVVALTPGPAVMCAMTHATRHGLRQAMWAIAGVQVGHFVFFGCVALGLAALLETATTAFLVLRWVGAIYLGYLGVRTLLGTFRTPTGAGAATEPKPAPSGRRVLIQGLGIQLTNPKALLFMSALLPQFIDPEAPLGTQLCVLLSATIGIDVLVLSAYALLAARGARSLRAVGFTIWLERVFGVALILFGVRLLSARK